MGCMAAAQTLYNMEYVHINFKGHSHGESMAVIEASLGLNNSFRAFDASTMTMIHRRPGAVSTWLFLFPCTHCMSRANLTRACGEIWHKPSWLHRASTDAPLSGGALLRGAGLCIRQLLCAALLYSRPHNQTA